MWLKSPELLRMHVQPVSCIVCIKTASIADVNSWDYTKQQTTVRQTKIKHSIIQPPTAQIDTIYITVHHGVLIVKGEEKGDDYHDEPHNWHWKDLLMAQTFIFHSFTMTLGKAWRHCKARLAIYPELQPLGNILENLPESKQRETPTYLNQRTHPICFSLNVVQILSKINFMGQNWSLPFC